MSFLSPIVVASLILATIAFILPWLTHFADSGLSFLAHAGWLVVSIMAIVTQRKRGLLVLLGAPLALFWPVGLAWIIFSGGSRIGF